MNIAYTLDELVAILGSAEIEAKTEGRAAEKIRGISALSEAGPEDLSFLANAKYRKVVAQSHAGAILLPEDYNGSPRANQVFLRVQNPSLALARICEHIAHTQVTRPEPGIHAQASVAATASIADDAYVGPFCIVEPGARIGKRVILKGHVFIGEGVHVGDDSIIHSHVSLYPGTIVGARVILHAGAAIGADGFGYELQGGIQVKIPQIGRVVIEDDVEIGANTCVDRARFSETRIEAGSKIDNLVQIGHNVQIGKHCVIAAQAGISGSARIGDYSMLGGQCGVNGHVTLGMGCGVGGQAGVAKDLPSKSFVTGTPALPVRESYRIEIMTRKLPDLLDRLGHLEDAVRANAKED